MISHYVRSSGLNPENLLQSCVLSSPSDSLGEKVSKMKGTCALNEHTSLLSNQTFSLGFEGIGNFEGIESLKLVTYLTHAKKKSGHHAVDFNWTVFVWLNIIRL